MSKVKETVSAFLHKFDGLMTFRINQLILEEEEKVDKLGLSFAKLRSSLSKSDFCPNTLHRVIATTQPTTQNKLKHLLLGRYYYR